jgi:hypothetical protein
MFINLASIKLKICLVPQSFGMASPPFYEEYPHLRLGHACLSRPARLFQKGVNNNLDVAHGFYNVRLSDGWFMKVLHLGVFPGQGICNRILKIRLNVLLGISPNVTRALRLIRTCSLVR